MISLFPPVEDISREAVSTPPPLFPTVTSWPETPEEVSFSNADLVPVLLTIARIRNADPAKVLERLRPRLERMGELPGLAFDSYRNGPGDQAVIVPDLPPDAWVWILGDVHGDLLALETTLHHIRCATPVHAKKIILFLGDLIDDNPDSSGVVLRFMELAGEFPGGVALLAGNHDEAIGMDADMQFWANVEPCDFKDWLNRHGRTDSEVALGEAFIRLVASAPRAVFLPDGILATHGGIPHTDLHAGINSAEDLARPECLQDFVWTRVSRMPRKIPNRTVRGCQFGVKDFDAFCAVATRVVGRPVNGMVRGHDHVERRFDAHPQYMVGRVLTVNTMGHRLAREFGGEYSRPFGVALYRTGLPLKAFLLSVPEGVTRSVYPESDEVPPD